MALYGKYRPQNFANLVGQDHIRETILHEIQKSTLAHAYLFAGPRGTGKTSTARLIAKALNCLKKNAEGEPCDACDICLQIKEGSLIDVIEIDAASNRGIDEIRELKEKIHFAPTRCKSKTYIIDEVHMLTKEAFNALLKTLEEPPENVYFILCTTEIHKIPETIISRCQRFDFKRIEMKTIMTRLSYIAQLEHIETEDGAIELIAQHVEGGLRDAIGIFEQLVHENKLSADRVREHLGITGHRTITTLIELLEQRELAKAIHLVNQIHSEGYDLTSFVREILEALREKLISGIQKGGAAATVSHELLEMIAKFEEARDMLRTTVIPQLPLEIAVIKICGHAPAAPAHTQSRASAMPSARTATARAPHAHADVPSVATPAPSRDPAQATHAVPRTLEVDLPAAPESTAATAGSATAAESATATHLKNEYELERFKGANISRNWQRVMEHIQPASLRRSISSASVSEPQPGTVLLSFGSRFHMEKVNTVPFRAAIEKAITHLFGTAVKVMCEVDELKLRSSDEPTKALPKAPSATQKSSSEDLAAKAFEIFGEE